jgi:hypothetical protein
VDTLRAQCRISRSEKSLFATRAGEGVVVFQHPRVEHVGHVQVAGAIHRHPGGSAQAGAADSALIAGIGGDAYLADDDIGRPVGGEGGDTGPAQHAVVFAIRHPHAVGAGALVDRDVAAVLAGKSGGLGASQVFGQAGSFTTTACDPGRVSAQHLCYPRQVTVDGDDIAASDASLSPPYCSLGSAEPLDAQAERGGGRGERVVRRRDRFGANSGRDCDMKRVKRPERDGIELDQQITSAYGVSIFQGMYLKKSLSYVVFEGRRGAALRAAIDVAVPPAAPQEAT